MADPSLTGWAVFLPDVPPIPNPVPLTGTCSLCGATVTTTQQFFHAQWHQLLAKALKMDPNG